MRRGLSEVKVEVNPVGRGTLLPTQGAELFASAADEFKRTLRQPILAPAELYGSKLVAAKWKLENIRKLKQSNPRKHAELLARLEEKLEL